MEESFENYLAGSDEDSLFSGRGASRYGVGSASRYGIGAVSPVSTAKPGSFLSPDSVESPGSTFDSGLLRGTALGSGYSPGGLAGISGYDEESYGINNEYASSGKDAYDFDIDLSKQPKDKKKKKKKKVKRDKEKEREEKIVRESELKKTKEERMAELLGQLDSERQAQKEAELEEQRREELAEQQRRQLELEKEKEEEMGKQAAMQADSEGEINELDFPVDSLELSDTDFVVGGYQRKSQAALEAVALQSNKSEDEDSKGEDAHSPETSFDGQQDENVSTGGAQGAATDSSLHLETLRKELEQGTNPKELASRLSFGDLSGLMKINSDEDDDDMDGDEEDRGLDFRTQDVEFEGKDAADAAAEISASFKADGEDAIGSDEQEESEQDTTNEFYDEDFDPLHEGESESEKPEEHESRSEVEKQEEAEQEGIVRVAENVEKEQPGSTLSETFAQGKVQPEEAGSQQYLPRAAGNEGASRTWSVGSRLTAKLFDWTQFYPGRVESINADETLNLVFDDGEKVESVFPSQVLFEDGAAATRSPDPLLFSDSHDNAAEGPQTEAKPTPPAESNPQFREDRSHETAELLQVTTSRLAGEQDLSSSNHQALEEVDESDGEHNRSTTPPLPESENEEDRDPKKSSTSSESPPESRADQMRKLFWAGMPQASTEEVSEDSQLKESHSGLKQSGAPSPPPINMVASKRKIYALSAGDKSSKPGITLRRKANPSPPPPPPPMHKNSLKVVPPPGPGLASHVDRVNRLGGRSPGLREQVARLKLERSALEGEVESMQGQIEAAVERASKLEKELQESKAQVFELTSRVQELEGTNALRKPLQKVLEEEGMSISVEEARRIEKEMAEQDRLLAGFQKENERLVAELRAAEQRAKEVRVNMFQANARFSVEENSKAKEPTAGIESGETSANDLRRRLDAEQAVEALQQQVETMKAEHSMKQKALREQVAALQATVSMAKGPDQETQAQIAALREELAEARFEHLTEAKALKSKLAWYVDNQELINESAKEVERLRDQLKEAHNQSEKASRSKAQHDAKRVRVLEKQVKELQDALNKRNPDCLANLILAAGPTESEQQSKRVMKERVAELEEELEKQGKAHALRVRTLRQEHERVKLGYERQLSIAQTHEENSEADFQARASSGPASEARVVALEKELANVREFYRKKIETLSKKSSMALRAATRDGVHASQSTEGSTQRDADKLRASKAALEARVEELELQLTTLGRSSGKTKRPVKSSRETKLAEENEILQEELRSLRARLECETKFEENNEKQAENKENEVPMNPADEASNSANANVKVNINTAAPSKDVSDVMQSRLVSETRDGNRLLEQEINKLQQDKQLLSLKLSEALAQRATLTEHYERALRRSESAVRSLHTSNAELEAQLSEAKRELELPSTPSLLQQQALARRLTDMEQKFAARERELELIVRQVEHRSELDLQEEKARHAALLAAKNNEIMRFRLELDSLVATLQLLQPSASAP